MTFLPCDCTGKVWYFAGLSCAPDLNISRSNVAFHWFLGSFILLHFCFNTDRNLVDLVSVSWRASQICCQLQLHFLGARIMAFSSKGFELQVELQ